MDKDQVRFLIKAGIAAEARWKLPAGIQIIFAEHKQSVILPVSPSGGFWGDGVPGDGSIAYGQAKVDLERYADGRHVIWMGYSERARTLVLMLKETE